MHTPPSGPTPPPMPYRPQRPPRQGVPALGVIVLCAFSLLAGCVGGAAIASSTNTGSASATSSASPSATSSTKATRTPRGSTEGDDDDRKRRTVQPKRTSSKPKPRRTTRAPSLDRRYSSCVEANRAGLGPYVRGVDPEYRWYQDRDGDGRVCER